MSRRRTEERLTNMLTVNGDSHPSSSIRLCFQPWNMKSALHYSSVEYSQSRAIPCALRRSRSLPGHTRAEAKLDNETSSGTNFKLALNTRNEKEQIICKRRHLYNVVRLCFFFITCKPSGSLAQSFNASKEMKSIIVHQHYRAYGNKRRSDLEAFSTW